MFDVVTAGKVNHLEDRVKHLEQDFVTLTTSVQNLMALMDKALGLMERQALEIARMQQQRPN